MIATDELRRALDERGVEHVDEKDGKYLLVSWSYNETSATFVEDTVSGETSIAISATVTPEQAIAATLGRGECHDKNGFDPDTGFECTVCGAMVDSYMVTPADTGHEVQFHFCPFCGRGVDA